MAFYRLLQQRHRMYRVMLAVEAIGLISLGPLQREPRLVSLLYVVISGAAVRGSSAVRHALAG